MNLWLRLLWLIIRYRHRPALQLPGDVSRLSMRVLPNDLDANLHMNNGRYFTIMDLGRLDLLFRAGATWGLIRRKGWAPMVGALQMRFRLPLALFQKYALETRILCWDEQWFFIEQRFILDAGPRKGAVAAIALLRGGFFDGANKRMLPVREMLDILGISATSPQEPDYVTHWRAAELEMKAVTA